MMHTTTFLGGEFKHINLYVYDYQGYTRYNKTYSMIKNKKK